VTAAAIPTREGPHGARFDFNEGCRVALPETGKPWRVRISDLDTGNILYETEIAAGRVSSTKQYFIRFRVELWQAGESVLAHEYSAEGQEVLIQFPVGTLGDTMGWFPYAVKFLAKHRCKLTCAMAEKLIPLFKDALPGHHFLTEKEVEAEREANQALLRLLPHGPFFDDKDCTHQPAISALSGCRVATSSASARPRSHRRSSDDDGRPTPALCLHRRADLERCEDVDQPDGLARDHPLLKEGGYRVVCIDQRRCHGTGLMEPSRTGSRTRLGDKPPSNGRAGWHANSSSGLSGGVVARLGDGHPSCLIGGFTAATNEFATPYRHQLPRLQRLLERPAPPVRPSRFPVVPLTPGRRDNSMHPADYRRAGQAGDPADPRLLPRRPGQARDSQGRRRRTAEIADKRTLGPKLDTTRCRRAAE
jgi:autotransporter strand-loop-strand O-heptosyltransferase